MKSSERNKLCYCGSKLKYKNCCIKHENQYTIFVDEAGNSGSNYLDLDQPFYLVGGWIIPNSHLASTTIIDEVAKALNVNGELKGTNLSGNKKNQREFKVMFEKMEAFDCKPFIVFAEKKYCIAGKIIETFLDPEYNNKISDFGTYTSDNLLKKRLAEKIYNLSFDTLKQFGQAYRLLDPAAMEQSLKIICDELSAVNEFDLADKLSGALSYIAEISNIEKQTHIQFLPNNASASLNVTAFFSLINHLERYARNKKITMSIIHDKTKAYEPGYTQVFKLASEAVNASIQLTDGTNIVTGYNNVKGIQFHDSKDSPWIQASDLLISSLNRFLKKIYIDEEVNSELLALGKYINSSVSFNGIKMGDSICSEDTREKIKSAI